MTPNETHDNAGPAPHPSNLNQLATNLLGRFSPEPLIVDPSVPTSPSTIVTPDGQPWTDGTDFIDTYASWADVLEFPRAVHEAIAIQLIASVLNRSGVVIDWAGYQLSMDFWMAIIAQSGGGKSTSINPVREILRVAEISDLIDSTDWGSKEKFYEILSGVSTESADFESSVRQSQFYTWTELSHHMKKLNSPAFEGVKPWLADLYDNFDVPQTITYRDVTKNIIFNHAPRTNILGLSSDSWFFTNLIHEDSTGGFMPRWTIVDAPGDRSVPKPPKRNPSTAQLLGAVLNQIAQLPGGLVQFFDGFSEVESLDENAPPSSLAPYNIWYRATRERFRKADPELGLIFFGRHRIHILKLAVVFEVSMSRTLRVSPEAWERAVAKAREFETTLFRFFRTGMTGQGKILTNMEDAILRAGRSGMAKTEFASRFKNILNWKQLRDTLVETGAVESVTGTKPPRGRIPELLVHRTFLE